VPLANIGPEDIEVQHHPYPAFSQIVF